MKSTEEETNLNGFISLHDELEDDIRYELYEVLQHIREYDKELLEKIKTLDKANADRATVYYKNNDLNDIHQYLKELLIFN